MSVHLEKVRWRLREYPRDAFHALARRGLVPTHRDYTPFVIVCNIRTGSTMLTDYLDNHPAVLCFFELFHRDMRGVPFGCDGFRRRGADPRVVTLRNEDPAAFLDREIFRPVPRGYRAVGFKLLYTQAHRSGQWWFDERYRHWWNGAGSKPPWEKAVSDPWGYLDTRRDVRILHLTRRNLLRQVLSGATAHATAKWGIGASGGAPMKDERVVVRLDPDELAIDFEGLNRLTEEARARFASHRVLELTYEDLAAAPEVQLRRVQDFLGLPHRPVSTRTRKLATRPLADVIGNYDELQKRFAATPHAGYFDE